MMRFSKSMVSTLGKKIIMGMTGLALSGFIVIHLAGNLTLLNPDKDPFNKYAHFLLNLGTLLYVAEAILGAAFLVHFIWAVVITVNNWRSRPESYTKTKGAGHTSRKTFASSTMIWSGLLIMLFLVLHLLHFKFGEVIMYTTKDGHYIRDLYALVYQFFSDPVNVAYYVIMMILLAFHVSHGFWSAFQSLGLNGQRFTPWAQKFAYLFAVVMGVGFLVLPVYIYFTTGGTV